MLAAAVYIHAPFTTAIYPTAPRPAQPSLAAPRTLPAMSSSLSPDMHTPLQSSTPAAATTPPVVPGGSTGSGLLSPTTPGPVAGGTHSAGGSRATYAPQSLTALEAYKKKDASKVVVRFKAIGNAPIMKNNYFRITAFNRFQAVIQFLRKELGWKAGDALVREGWGLVEMACSWLWRPCSLSLFLLTSFPFSLVSCNTHSISISTRLSAQHQTILLATSSAYVLLPLGTAWTEVD